MNTCDELFVIEQNNVQGQGKRDRAIFPFHFCLLKRIRFSNRFYVTNSNYIDTHRCKESYDFSAFSSSVSIFLVLSLYLPSIEKRLSGGCISPFASSNIFVCPFSVTLSNYSRVAVT